MKPKAIPQKAKPELSQTAISDPAISDPAAIGCAFVSQGGVPCLGSGEIERLFHDLGQANLPERTRLLMAAKLPKKAKKLIEEAAEVSLDAVLGNRKGLVNESVDVLYHLIVLWRSCDITPDVVWAEMNRRANNLGVSEKLPKSLNKREKQKTI